jgi:hypothetical protein
LEGSQNARSFESLTSQKALLCLALRYGFPFFLFRGRTGFFILLSKFSAKKNGANIPNVE